MRLDTLSLGDGYVLTYDDEKHRYDLLSPGGEKERLPSVSAIVNLYAKGKGFERYLWNLGRDGIDSDAALNEAKARGTAVHAALEAWNLERKVLVPGGPHAGYIEALRSALLDLRPEVTSAEGMVASVEHRYAGRFDFTARIKGHHVLVDLKTSKRINPLSMYLQLEGYEVARREMGLDPTDYRLVLQVGADGSYTVGESTATAEDFLRTLESYRRNKLIEKLRDRRVAEATARWAA